MKLTVKSPHILSCYVVLISLVSYLKLINFWPGFHFSTQHSDVVKDKTQGVLCVLLLPLKIIIILILQHTH